MTDKLEVRETGHGQNYYCTVINEQEKTREVMIKVSCTCQSGSIWRIGKVCKHVRAVLEELLKK